MLAVRETTAPYSTGPRLLDRVRHAIRARHYSRRTEKAYVGWIKRYIFFHGKRHPAEMGAAEVSQFLTSLAVQANVAASTQNQAMNALVFLPRRPRARLALARRHRPRPAPAALAGGIHPR